MKRVSIQHGQLELRETSYEAEGRLRAQSVTQASACFHLLTKLFAQL